MPAKSSGFAKRVAIIGTNGLPAKYGGFETLAKNLADNLQDELTFNVYCSSKNTSTADVKESATRLSIIPLKANGWQSVPYDMICMLIATLRGERILLLGSSGGLLVPLLRMLGKKVIVNAGGLEWQREKWGWATRQIIKMLEFFAVRFASVCIVDNEQIRNLYKERYNIDAEYIPYGGDHVILDAVLSRAVEYSWIDNPYALSVSRAQKDNNIHLILEAWETMGDAAPVPLVVISNWESSEYGLSLKRMFGDKENIVLLPAIYDQVHLDAIRSRARLYVHSHSACGTAPSLVEAMTHKVAVIAFDAPANRYTTNDAAFYFSTPSDLCSLLSSYQALDLSGNARTMGEIAGQKYTWEKCCESYRKFISN